MTVKDAQTITGRALYSGNGLSVVNYRCSAGPRDRPFAERHRRHSLSLVRRGSFSYCCEGRLFELAAGSVMVGRRGDEYRCSHEHHGQGDECLSFQFEPALADCADVERGAWRCGTLAPDPALAVLGGLAQAVADGRSAVSWDEVGLLLIDHLLKHAEESPPAPAALPASTRRRAVQAALWIDEHSRDAIELADAARAADLSPFHLVRLFSRLFGVTPHQYLIRCRLRDAASLLADPTTSVTDVAFVVGFGDLSNFVRTFGCAAGLSPSRFRSLGKTERRMLLVGRNFRQALNPATARP